MSGGLAGAGGGGGLALGDAFFFFLPLVNMIYLSSDKMQVNRFILVATQCKSKDSY